MINRDVDEQIANIQSKLTQLNAFLAVSISDDFVANVSDSVRSSYLWGCSDLCEEIHVSTESLVSLLRRGK